jgi:hypothetical protein
VYTAVTPGQGWRASVQEGHIRGPQVSSNGLSTLKTLLLLLLPIKLLPSYVTKQ